MNGREVKAALYAQFSRVAKAVASPRRIELLELTAQAERGVDELARLTGMEVGNTSAQLQVLSRARLVVSRRRGKQVLYRIADPSVGRLVSALREVARARLAEVEQVARDYFESADGLEPVRRAELLARMERDDTVVLDVRPAAEYQSGHIAGAISMPLEELHRRIAELPGGVEVVAYCRGPYCVLAPQAVQILRRAGFRARRLTEGFPDWQLAELPIAVGVGR